jgi:hypothetical protein
VLPYNGQCVPYKIEVRLQGGVIVVSGMEPAMHRSRVGDELHLLFPVRAEVNHAWADV